MAPYLELAKAAFKAKTAHHGLTEPFNRARLPGTKHGCPASLFWGTIPRPI